MSSMHKHKISYKAGLDALMGDLNALAGDADSWQTGANVLAELTKGAGGLIAQQSAKEEAQKKAAADKEARKDVDEAINKAKAARANAIGKMAEAKAADMKARTEQDPNGPLHKKAKLAADTAVHYDADAVALELKAAALAESRGIMLPAGFGPSMQTPEQQAQMMKLQLGGGFPMKNLLIGGGIVVGGSGLLYLIYRLFKKR